MYILHICRYMYTCVYLSAELSRPKGTAQKLSVAVYMHMYIYIYIYYCMSASCTSGIRCDFRAVVPLFDRGRARLPVSRSREISCRASVTS